MLEKNDKKEFLPSRDDASLEERVKCLYEMLDLFATKQTFVGVDNSICSSNNRSVSSQIMTSDLSRSLRNGD